METRILRTVDEVNNLQKNVLFGKISKHFSEGLSGRTVAIWGLSFKPRTDDIREAPSHWFSSTSSLEAGCTINVHDPVAKENVEAIYGDKLNYFEHHYDACQDADALAIVTEWNEFRNPDFDYLKVKMASPAIFDGRNLYNPEKMKELGFTYSAIGLKV